MFGTISMEQGGCQGSLQGNKGNYRDLLINLRSFLIRRITFKPCQTISFSTPLPMSRLVKKYCFCQNLLKNLFVLQKKLSFLKFLGQYLIVPLLVCFQLNYNFFFISLIDTSCSSIVRFFLNDTIDVHENICAKKFCSQKRCPSLAKGMEMVLGLGGHSAFQEATEIISRGSWRLSPPPYLAGRGCI